MLVFDNELLEELGLTLREAKAILSELDLDELTEEETIDQLKEEAKKRKADKATGEKGEEIDPADGDELDDEDDTGDPVTKPTDKGGPSKAGDNAPSGKKRPGDKDDGEKKKITAEDIEIDVKDSMEALTESEDLTDGFKKKAAVIFESAIRNKVAEHVNEIQEDYDNQLTEAIDEARENLVESVNSYLEYVVEEWMKENELAIESGIKTDLSESFMQGIKDLFESHYVDVPEGKEDVIVALSDETEELQRKLDEQIEENIQTRKALIEFKKNEIFATVSESLTDTQKDKLQTLAEGISYDDEETYTDKMKTLVEAHFGTGSRATSTINDDADASVLNEEIDSEVAKFAQYMRKQKERNDI